MANAIGLALDIFGLPALAALAASITLVLLGRAVAPARPAVLLPWLVSVSFIAGYALLPREWASWLPRQDQPWQWLPYCGLIPALAASLAALARSNRLRWLGAISAVVVCAILLVPSWQVLGLSRWTMRCAAGIYLLIICVPLLLLPAALPGRPLMVLMSMAAVLLALGTGAMVSVRLAQLAAIAAAAFAGCCINPVQRAGRSTEESAAGIVSIFAALVGGVAWTACIDPDPPQLMLLAFPLLPLMLWLAALPLVKRTDRER